MKRILLMTITAFALLLLMGCVHTPADPSKETTMPDGTTAPVTTETSPSESSATPDMTTASPSDEADTDVPNDTSSECEGTTDPEPVTQIPENLVVVTDQKSGREGIAVYDLSKIDLSGYDFEQDHMEIDPSEAEVFRYTEGLYDVAGVKLRVLPSTGEYVLMIAYGSSYAAMISYPDGELLWSTSQTGQGPHSIELLPDEWIVVAAPGSSASDYSDGKLTFFNSKRTQPRLSVDLPNAHGVLYDPKGSCIWAVGDDQLRKYTYTAEGNKLSVTEEFSVTLPSSGAHDLAAYYGDTDKLIITTTEKVYVYQKSTGSFMTAAEDNGVKSAKRIKGIGILQDGSVIFTRPNEVVYSVRASWLTDCIVYHKWVDGEFVKYRLVSSQYEIYKLRVMRAEYQ